MTGHLVVFAGPTLAAARVEAFGAVALGPVAQGDVYRAALERPFAIGIIDGYFEHVPAVWHKEILWALSQGVRVFGSASMGALRAAELDTFGMVGVGAIYEAFRDEVYEDDDEVAVSHGPASEAYVQGSEAMVNIRATLAAAVLADVVTDDVRQELLRLIKAEFYAQRTWPATLALGRRQGLDTGQLDALKAWLPTGRIDQKRVDGVAMVQAMVAQRDQAPAPLTVGWQFQHTEVWDMVPRKTGRSAAGAGAAEQGQLLLDEVRLQGPLAWRQTQSLAMSRALAAEVAANRRFTATEHLVQQTAEAFRRERGLMTPQALERWRAEQGLDEAGFLDLIRRETAVRFAASLFAGEASRVVPDVLRATGAYASSAARAAQKQAHLSEHGWTNPGVDDTGDVSIEEIRRWFFGDAPGGLPDDLDRYAQGLGLPGARELDQLLLREFLFRERPLTKGRDPEDGSA